MQPRDGFGLMPPPLHAAPPMQPRDGFGLMPPFQAKKAYGKTLASAKKVL